VVTVINDNNLKAPFPWFGGKSKVAPLVWKAIGDVQHYVEPFAGSLAVLLGRPAKQNGTIETVNDLDYYIVNFWRALQHAPEEVAYHANNPVNECDLTARHIWLVNQGKERIARLQGDPEYYDAKVAGWWVWGICCWIGGSWCAGTGPWSAVDGKLVNLREIDSDDPGVSKRCVHLGDAGCGVNRQLVHLGNAGCGVNTGLAEIIEYLSTLAARLRYVRVCCGDWQRVVTDGALSHGDPVGIFLDPPYDIDMRGDCYNTDAENGNVSTAVREWCIENANNPRYRIVLAGYDGEHEIPKGWRVLKWSAGASYQRHNGGSANEENRHKERLWLSPNCLKESKNVMRLFEDVDNE
jgi:DNA adenine methylase